MAPAHLLSNRTGNVMTENILVVGGGAGGLELVVKLARKFSKVPGIKVTLIDRNPTHIWKPLLHEVATGSLNSYHDESSYRMLARKHRFNFVLGTVSVLDADARVVTLESVQDPLGEKMVPIRRINFTQLVLSVGSLSNDFGTRGVAEHCLLLDSRDQAERFHENFIRHLHRVNASTEEDAHLSVVIVGGGATGVELAADLHNVVKQLSEYGFPDFSEDRLRVSVVEAAPRVLAQLPERIGESVRKELQRIGVQVRTDSMVSAVESDAVLIGDAERVEAHLSVWAAGIKAPAFLAESGLPTDQLGRVEVDECLQVKGFVNLFAIGDCCACPMPGGGTVPPRAQSAHQMASLAMHNLVAFRAGKRLKPFVYKDFGSLVSLSEFSTIGNLMGNLLRGTVFIEGWLARLVYLSLYRMHQAAVHGLRSTLLIMLGDRIYRATRAELKLH